MNDVYQGCLVARWRLKKPGIHFFLRFLLTGLWSRLNSVIQDNLTDNRNPIVLTSFTRVTGVVGEEWAARKGIDVV